MKDWEKGLSKLLVLAYMGAEIEYKNYEKYNKCETCKTLWKGYEGYCLKYAKDFIKAYNFPEKICPHWRPQNEK